MQHKRVKRPVRLPPTVKSAGKRVAAWLNKAPGASELMDAIQELLVLGRAWDDPNDSDIYFVKWNEQFEAVGTMLDRWPARYVPHPEGRTFRLALEPYRKDSTADWNRLGELAVIAAANALDRLRRCGHERWVLYDWQLGMKQCNAWFFAGKSSQVFCSEECKDDYWNEEKRHKTKKLKPPQSKKKRKAWNEQRSKNRRFKLRGRRP
jgi:hypothetical protein